MSNYYVAKTGNNSNVGSLASPWFTIQKAFDVAESGDIVYVREGTYQESPIQNRNGLSGSTITFQNYLLEVPIIDGNNTLPEGVDKEWDYLIKIYGNYVNFIGFEIKNSTGTAIRSTGSNCILSYLIVHHNYSMGIFVQGNYNNILNCVSYNNNISNDAGDHTWGSALSIGDLGGSTTPSYGVIRGNVVYNNWGEGISTYGSDNIIIEDNTAYDNWSANIYICNATNTICRRNFLYRTQTIAPNGFEVGILFGDELDILDWSINNEFYNNIVYGCKRNFDYWGTKAGATNGLDHCYIYNNTFVNSIANVYDANVVIVDQHTNSTSYFKNNIIVQDGDIDPIYLYDGNNITFSNNLWSKSHDAKATGSGDVIDDPEFVNLNSPYLAISYKLQFTSPAINAGVEVGLITDYRGKPILGLPDIGAYEVNHYYYVAKTGNDSNVGTEASPFLTITKGLSVATADDIIYVKTGTYGEYVIFPTSGTLNNPITLKNYGTDIVTVDAQNTREICIVVSDTLPSAGIKSNIVIDGINCIGGLNTNAGITGENILIKNLISTLPIFTGSTIENFVIGSPISGWTRNITLQNVTTIGGDYGLYCGAGRIDGLTISGGTYSYASIDGLNFSTETYVAPELSILNVLVDGVESSYNGRQGVVTWNVSDSIFRNINSHHNGATGIQIENYNYNILIEDCECHDNCTVFTYETGIWIDDTSGATIRRCKLYNNSTGFRVTGSEGVIAYHLLIYDNASQENASGRINSSGISLVDDGVSGLFVNNVEIYNSVVYRNSHSSSQKGSIDIEGVGTYVLKNNIFSLDQTTYDYYLAGPFTLTSDYNLIYNTRALSIFNCSVYPVEWVAPSTWSEYKTASGRESHSVNANPLFVNG